jgi:RNA polymerase sigma factor (sigma-70 family)
MENTEEQVYINRIKNGDPASYAFIVDKYKYMAYTIALKILGNVEDAQDVAQESFIKAYQQIRQFEGKSKFSTWLYTIVYRTAISKLKENKIETLSITDVINENYPQDYTMPQLEQLQLEDEQRHVKQAIQKLPKTEALLVTLFYINENTIREIREITGLSLANIKIKLFRARKKLERELQFLIKRELNATNESGK